MTLPRSGCCFWLVVLWVKFASTNQEHYPQPIPQTLFFRITRSSFVKCWLLAVSCLPFKWATYSVHSLGKWSAQFWTNKFHCGVAFTINCTDQLHSWTKKRPRRPETGIKDGFEEMEHKFPFGLILLEKQDYLFRCSVAPGNCPLEWLRKSCSIYFPTGFFKNVCKWSTTVFSGY